MSATYDDVSTEYIKYRDDIPAGLIPSLNARSIEFEGAKIADFGAGPGFMSDLIGTKGGIVDAVEPSEEFYDYGRRHFKDNYKVNFNLKHAEDTGLPSKTYDIVIALRSWHWFDRPATLEEIKRILKPGGYLIIVDFGFIRASDIVKESMKFIKKSAKNYKVKSKIHREKSSQRINGFPIEWIKEWEDFNFDIKDIYKEYYKVEVNHEEWIGRLGSSSAMVEFKKKHRKKTLKKLSAHLKDRCEEDEYKIPHEMNVIILQNIN